MAYCPNCDDESDLDAAPTRSEFDCLAELIGAERTDEALQLLKEMFPDLAPWPNHVRRRVTDRRAYAAGRVA